MRIFFYPRLAWTGIRKNRRLYDPYIFTCMGMVMMFYIMSALSSSEIIKELHGGGEISFVLGLGQWVIGFFSLLFLFYTNSFLLRRRNKEFGLYHVLGMDKRNVSKVIAAENLFISAVGLGGGLLFGIAFSKLAELGLMNALRAEVDYKFRLSPQAVLHTVLVYAGVFGLLFLHALWKIRRLRPLELLRSDRAGEKPPRANWLCALSGFVLLGIAYRMAVTIESPIAALEWFFAAVLMVIAATYLLFMAGAVTLCRMLQKSKKYYYAKEHFVPLASMAYRMRRNGAGLSSICILSTMVLVMISSTTSLFFGVEDACRARYPRDIVMECSLSGLEAAERLDAIRETARETAARNQAAQERTLDYTYAVISGLMQGDRMEVSVEKVGPLIDYSKVYMAFLFPLEEYNRLTGRDCTLEPGEALVCANRIKYTEEYIQIGDTEKLRIKEIVPHFADNGISAVMAIPMLYIIVDPFEEYVEPLAKLADYNGNPMLNVQWQYAFDLHAPKEKQIEICRQLKDAVSDRNAREGIGITGFNCVSCEEQRAGFYELYGGLFFLGILLSIVFVVAAVLIIYYKQICEGYEDQARFEIMQKVGMTRQDIRRSINSQVLTVFFSPLLLAGLHLCFAYPMIWKVLQMLNLWNLKLVICVTIVSFLAFALFYTAVYKMTSNAYYTIVSGRE